MGPIHIDDFCLHVRSGNEIVIKCHYCINRLTDWWLGCWTSNLYPELNDGYYIMVYSLLMIFAAALSWANFLIFNKVTVQSSKRIFEQLIDKIMKAPLWWVKYVNDYSISSISLRWAE